MLPPVEPVLAEVVAVAAGVAAPAADVSVTAGVEAAPAPPAVLVSVTNGVVANVAPAAGVVAPAGDVAAGAGLLFAPLPPLQAARTMAPNTKNVKSKLNFFINELILLPNLPIRYSNVCKFEHKFSPRLLVSKRDHNLT